MQSDSVVDDSAPI